MATSWPAATVALAATVAVAGCQREGQSQMRAPEQGPSVATQVAGGPLAERSGVVPGIHPTILLGHVHNPYAGNAAAAAEGRQLFVQYNCSGCHGGRAGGGMGPTLRDSARRLYGNSDAQLYGTIFEGRPAGMPTWGAKISSDQIWKLVTYIRTLATSQEPDPPPPQDHPPLAVTGG